MEHSTLRYIRTFQNYINKNNSRSALNPDIILWTDIETDPALEAGESELVVVYDETMDDEDKEETAFTCTFHDKEGLGNMLGMLFSSPKWWNSKVVIWYHGHIMMHLNSNNRIL